MSSGDEEAQIAAQSPNLGASSSKDPPPPLHAESSDEEDELPMQKSKKSYNRPRIEWREVLCFSEGADVTMGEDEMKLQITQAYNQFMPISWKIHEWSVCQAMFRLQLMSACGN